MRIVPGFMIRQIAGETIAIPSGEAARHLSGLMALNGTGAFLFELLQTERTEEELAQLMIKEYEVDEDTAKADVSDFVSILRKNGVLVESTTQV